MIFHENRLLADDSHVIAYFIFVKNWERCQNVSSAAVVIVALRVIIGTSQQADTDGPTPNATTLLVIQSTCCCPPGVFTI